MKSLKCQKKHGTEWTLSEGKGLMSLNPMEVLQHKLDSSNTCWLLISSPICCVNATTRSAKECCSFRSSRDFVTLRDPQKQFGTKALIYKAGNITGQNLETCDSPKQASLHHRRFIPLSPWPATNTEELPFKQWYMLEEICHTFLYYTRQPSTVDLTSLTYTVLEVSTERWIWLRTAETMCSHWAAAWKLQRNAFPALSFHFILNFPLCVKSNFTIDFHTTISNFATGGVAPCWLSDTVQVWAGRILPLKQSEGRFILLRPALTPIPP